MKLAIISAEGDGSGTVLAGVQQPLWRVSTDDKAITTENEADWMVISCPEETNQ